MAGGAPPQSLRGSRGTTGARYLGVETQGLSQFLNAVSRDLGPAFNRELRKAAETIARTVVTETQSAAGSHPTPKLYSEVVRRALRARRDRFPTIRLSESTVLKLSRDAAVRKRAKAAGTKPHRVTAGDVWFGAEFGGRGSPTTRQFPPHRGTRGYIFFPTVRRMRPRIQEEYLAAIDQVLAAIAGGPTG